MPYKATFLNQAEAKLGEVLVLTHWWQFASASLLPVVPREAARKQ